MQQGGGGSDWSETKGQTLQSRNGGKRKELFPEKQEEERRGEERGRKTEGRPCDARRCGFSPSVASPWRPC